MSGARRTGGGRGSTARRWMRRLVPAEVQAPPPGLARRLVARTGYFRLRTWAAAHGETVPDARALPAALLALARRPGLRAGLRRGRRAARWSAATAATCSGAPSPRPWRSTATWSSAASSAAARRCSRRRPCATPAASGRCTWSTASPACRASPRGRTASRRATSARPRPTSVRAALAPFPFARVHEGVIPAILDEVGVERVAWAHIDVNVYAAVRDCLEFLYPRMAPGGVDRARRLRLPELSRRPPRGGRVLRRPPGGPAVPSHRPMPDRQAAVAAPAGAPPSPARHARARAAAAC